MTAGNEIKLPCLCTVHSVIFKSNWSVETGSFAKLNTKIAKKERNTENWSKSTINHRLKVFFISLILFRRRYFIGHIYKMYSGVCFFVFEDVGSRSAAPRDQSFIISLEYMFLIVGETRAPKGNLCRHGGERHTERASPPRNSTQDLVAVSQQCQPPHICAPDLFCHNFSSLIRLLILTYYRSP